MSRVFFFGLCLTSELCSTGIVTDWTRNSQTPREGDFESDQDLNSDPLPMIPYQEETQFFASQPSPVSVSGLIPSLSAAPVPCWFRKCPNQAMVTQTVQEYPHQLASQTQGLHDTPRMPCMQLLQDVLNSVVWHKNPVCVKHD